MMSVGLGISSATFRMSRPATTSAGTGSSTCKLDENGTCTVEVSVLTLVAGCAAEGTVLSAESDMMMVPLPNTSCPATTSNWPLGDGNKVAGGNETSSSSERAMSVPG